MSQPTVGIAEVGRDKEALKSQYLECLATVSEIGTSLRQSVLRLVALGVTARQLVAWAAAAGYPERQVRKILSRILLQAGVRRRRSGSGPKTPPEAEAIVASVRAQYGRRATRFLRAALRLAVAQDKARSAAAQAAQNQGSTGQQPTEAKADGASLLEPALIPDQDKPSLVSPAPHTGNFVSHFQTQPKPK